MFLKTLTISSSGGLIREINFHKGLNLIVDESKTLIEKKKSGNNVGKTTILRLINFCLGGDAKSIYQDPEFKEKSNEIVKEFLLKQHVFVTLVLKEELAIESSREISLCRNFLQRKQKVQKIDGKNYSDDQDYDLAIKKLLFNFDNEKPTFKQIRAKNIRDEAARLENTVKVLNSYTRDEEYEALYLFWLGIPHPDAEKKKNLLEKKRIEEQLLNRLRKQNDESKIEQFLAIIQTEIDALEIRKNNFNINDNYSDDLIRLSEVNAQLNALSASQGQLELRKELIEESCRDLQSDMASTKTDMVAELYKQAKILIPTLQRTYEETVAFHNKMLKEKSSFIAKELPSINEQLRKIKHQIQEALVAERQLKDKLQKVGIVEELQPIIAELNVKHEQKGKLTEQRSQMQSIKTILSSISREIDNIDQVIMNSDSLIQKRVKAFNSHFSAISERLYGEKYALTAPQKENLKKGSKFYELKIDSLNGRPGTGKKKGEIAAFDIAYMKFADQEKLPCLHFILHDQMEVIDDHQMVSLRDEVVRANCQFIVPILRDKLPSELTDSTYQIISLSENDKLFRI